MVLGSAPTPSPLSPPSTVSLQITEELELCGVGPHGFALDPGKEIGRVGSSEVSVGTPVHSVLSRNSEGTQTRQWGGPGVG